MSLSCKDVLLLILYSTIIHHNKDDISSGYVNNILVIRGDKQGIHESKSKSRIKSLDERYGVS